MRNIPYFVLAGLVASLSMSCAAAPPPVPQLVNEQVNGERVIRLPESVFQSTWDGAVKWSIEASEGSTVALVTVSRESERSLYRECRDMAMKPAPDVDRLDVEASYTTELETRTGDSVETFRAPVTRDQLSAFAAGLSPTFMLCDDPFALSNEQADRVAEFAEAWRAPPQ